MAGKYFSNSGEMRAAARHYDLKLFAVEVVEHLTHEDANVFRTPRLLLFLMPSNFGCSGLLRKRWP